MESADATDEHAGAEDPSAENQSTDDPSDDPGAEDDPAADLDAVNAALAEWSARSATQSDALIERFEAMGYAVRGKSEEEIAAVLRRPPTQAR